MKGILFNQSMVRAILDGRKTVTRRVVKKPRNNVYKTPYKVGDVLYVRETFAVGRIDCGDDDKLFISQCVGENSQIPKEYALRNDIGIDDVVWTPSIHMPKEAARIFLKVTNVRVERLNDIRCDCELDEVSKEGIALDLDDVTYDVFKENFIGLWNSTIKKTDLDQYGWDANPWVWVTEFERCEREIE